MNKTKFKKLCTIAFVGLIFLSLAGCSNKKAEAEDNKKPETSQIQKEPAKNEPEVKDLIRSIKKVKTKGLVDTFVVKHFNGKITSFTITYTEDGKSIDKIEEIVKDGKEATTIEIKDGTWHFNNQDTTIKVEGIRDLTKDEKGEPAKPGNN